MQFLLKLSDDPGQELDFTISEPEYCSDGAYCKVTLNGHVLFRSIIGTDPMNAIENAVAAVRAYLAGLGVNLAWSDGSSYVNLP